MLSPPTLSPSHSITQEAFSSLFLSLFHNLSKTLFDKSFVKNCPFSLIRVKKLFQLKHGLRFSMRTSTTHVQPNYKYYLPTSTSYFQALRTYKHYVPTSTTYLQALRTYKYSLPSSTMYLQVLITIKPSSTTYLQVPPTSRNYVPTSTMYLQVLPIYKHYLLTSSCVLQVTTQFNLIYWSKWAFTYDLFNMIFSWGRASRRPS